MACCVMHNFLLDERDEGRGLQLYQSDGRPNVTDRDKIYHEDTPSVDDQRATAVHLGSSGRMASLMSSTWKRRTAEFLLELRRQGLIRRSDRSAETQARLRNLTDLASQLRVEAEEDVVIMLE